ncbi:MAG: radical SAM protein [Nitrospirae bacterium]|nr:radical SAM protein [Nitrospirota bacterium]
MGSALNYALNLISVAVGRRPSRPLLFSYYITHRCGLRCAYCSDGDGASFREDVVDELSTEDAKRLVGMLARSADTLDITGGEPLERDDIEEVLAHARHAGMATVLNTKGIGLESRKEIIGLANVLVLSVDSLDEDRLTALTGNKTAARGILDSLEYSVRTAADAGTALVLSAVATPANLDDVADVLGFALENRLGFHISPDITGRSVNPALRDNPVYDRLMSKVLDAKKTRSGVLGVPEYLDGIRYFREFRCAPLLMPAIRPDGRLYYPCLEFKRADESVLERGGYEAALTTARKSYGGIPDCSGRCHIFCHMGLTMFQAHPVSAMREDSRFAGRR